MAVDYEQPDNALIVKKQHSDGTVRQAQAISTTKCCCVFELLLYFRLGRLVLLWSKANVGQRSSLQVDSLFILRVAVILVFTFGNFYVYIELDAGQHIHPPAALILHAL